MGIGVPSGNFAIYISWSQSFRSTSLLATVEFSALLCCGSGGLASGDEVVRVEMLEMLVLDTEALEVVPVLLSQAKDIRDELGAEDIVDHSAQCGSLV